MRDLLRNALNIVVRNKRYIFWFWILNLTSGEFGTAAFRRAAHAALDHSSYAGGLVHGFDLGVLAELLMRSQSGTFSTVYSPALYFAFLFFVATALFLPGVFAGYASRYTLPRDDFFRACGRNLWRFIRLMIVAGILMGGIGYGLYEAMDPLVEVAGKSTYELLPFAVQVAIITLSFLIMTTLRIWFDLAEADIVLSDRRVVRKSIALGLHHANRNLGRLLNTYVAITIVAIVILAGGLWMWNRLVPAESAWSAFVVGQLTLFLLLIPRFWQRAVAVTYWQRNMIAPLTQPMPPASGPASTGAPQPA